LNTQPIFSGLIQALKRIRKQIGLSQQELSVQLGVALPTLSRLENWQIKPSPFAIEKIEASLLEVSREGGELIDKYIRI